MKTRNILILVGLITFVGIGEISARGYNSGKRKYRMGGPGGKGGIGEMIEQRIKTQRAVELAIRLKVDESKAAAMAKIMDEYHVKRMKLRMENHDYIMRLRELGEKDSPDSKEIEKLIKEVKVNRNAVISIDHEELNALANGLTPKQKAQLVVFLHEFPQEIRRMIRQQHRQRGNRFNGQGPDEPMPPMDF